MIKLPFNLSAKLWVLVAVAIAIVVAFAAGAWWQHSACVATITADTVEELQDDQETANALSTDAVSRIRELELTIARIRRERSEIDNCIIPDTTQRLRQTAVSAAFPSP